jgi:hypothetical protein
MIKAISTLAFIVVFLPGSSYAQKSNSDWRFRQPPAPKNSNRKAPMTSTSLAQKEIETIIDRFIFINRQFEIATTDNQFIRNASNLELLIDQLEKFKRIERAATPGNRKEISDTRKQLERILEIRLRQHSNDAKHLVFLNDLKNAQGYLDILK